MIAPKKITPSVINEQRSFKMHSNLLYSVIKSQAGTLAKALLELVMNSIDAGATSIDVKFTRTTFSITDNGKGFTERRQIDEFFETFGTPHVEGDATYGKFRMGRGQIMAFSKNTWKSGPFTMNVDIQGRGLDYTLETSDTQMVKGCSIEGTLYDTMLPSDVLATENLLKEQCKYTPVPITINGKPGTMDCASEKWTQEDDNAYYKLNTARTLSVYNLGVLVAHFHTSEFGVGGVVVSKKQLELNFARNDILRSQCKVWKAIRPVLTANASSGKTKVKRDEGWRAFQCRNWLTQTPSSDRYEELPLFTDVVGRHYSLMQLCNASLPITEANEGDLKADTIQQRGMAIVLREDLMGHRFGFDLLTVCKTLLAHAAHNYTKHYITQVTKRYASLKDLAKGMVEEHTPLLNKELSKPAAAALGMLNRSQHYCLHALQTQFDNLQVRQLRAMRSNTCDAYTDGSTVIYINEKFLKGANGPNQGITWASRMIALLVHEYCHAFNSGVGHTHDAEFFEAFHNVMINQYLAHAYKEIPMSWAKVATEELGGASHYLLQQVDKQTTLDDKLVVTAPVANEAMIPVINDVVEVKVKKTKRKAVAA